MKDMRLPARFGVRQTSLTRPSEKPALPAPIMLIFSGVAIDRSPLLRGSHADTRTIRVRWSPGPFPAAHPPARTPRTALDMLGTPNGASSVRERDCAGSCACPGPASQGVGGPASASRRPRGGCAAGPVRMPVLMSPQATAPSCCGHCPVWQDQHFAYNALWGTPHQPSGCPAAFRTSSHLHGAPGAKEEDPVP